MGAIVIVGAFVEMEDSPLPLKLKLIGGETAWTDASDFEDIESLSVLFECEPDPEESTMMLPLVALMCRAKLVLVCRITFSTVLDSLSRPN